MQVSFPGVWDGNSKAGIDSNMGPLKLGTAEVPAMSNLLGRDYFLDQIHFLWERDAFKYPKFEKPGNKPPALGWLRSFGGIKGPKMGT